MYTFALSISLWCQSYSYFLALLGFQIYEYILQLEPFFKAALFIYCIWIQRYCHNGAGELIRYIPESHDHQISIGKGKKDFRKKNGKLVSSPQDARDFCDALYCDTFIH